MGAVITNWPEYYNLGAGAWMDDHTLYTQAGVPYYESGVDYYDTAAITAAHENHLHTLRINEICSERISAVLMAITALATAVDFYGKYRDAVSSRRSINDRLSSCLRSMHDHWSNFTHEHHAYSLNQAIAVAEISIDRQDQLDHVVPVADSLAEEAKRFERAQGDKACNDVDQYGCDENDVDSYRVLAQINAAHQLTRLNERRREDRQSLKAEALTVGNKGVYANVAPAVNAYNTAGQLINGVAAQYSSAFNSSMGALGHSASVLSNTGM